MLFEHNFTQFINRYSYILVFLIAFIFSKSSFAQARPFDNGETVTIKAKTLQNENYFSFNKMGDQDVQSLYSLLRYGVTENVELQVGWNGSMSGSGTSAEGSSSTNVGLKMALTEDMTYLPSLALIASVNLTAQPSENPISPTLNLLYEKNLLNNLIVNGNYQVGINEQNGDFSTSFSFNVETEFTDWNNTYLGIVHNTMPGELENNNQTYIELGMLFWVRDRITLYPFYDFGLNDNSPDIFNLGILISITD